MFPLFAVKIRCDLLFNNEEKSGKTAATDTI
jgi:hypothetical protein